MGLMTSRMDPTIKDVSAEIEKIKANEKKQENINREFAESTLALRRLREENERLFQTFEDLEQKRDFMRNAIAKKEESVKFKAMEKRLLQDSLKELMLENEAKAVELHAKAQAMWDLKRAYIAQLREEIKALETRVPDPEEMSTFRAMLKGEFVLPGPSEHPSVLMQQAPAGEKLIEVKNEGEINWKQQTGMETSDGTITFSQQLSSSAAMSYQAPSSKPLTPEMPKIKLIAEKTLFNTSQAQRGPLSIKGRGSKIHPPPKATTFTRISDRPSSQSVTSSWTRHDLGNSESHPISNRNSSFTQPYPTSGAISQGSSNFYKNPSYHGPVARVGNFRSSMTFDQRSTTPVSKVMAPRSSGSQQSSMTYCSSAKRSNQVSSGWINSNEESKKFNQSLNPIGGNRKETQATLTAATENNWPQVDDVDFMDWVEINEPAPSALPSGKGTFVPKKPRMN